MEEGRWKMEDGRREQKGAIREISQRDHQRNMKLLTSSKSETSQFVSKNQTQVSYCIKLTNQPIKWAVGSACDVSKIFANERVSVVDPTSILFRVL